MKRLPEASAATPSGAQRRRSRRAGRRPRTISAITRDGRDDAALSARLRAKAQAGNQYTDRKDRNAFHFQYLLKYQILDVYGRANRRTVRAQVRYAYRMTNHVSHAAHRPAQPSKTRKTSQREPEIRGRPHTKARARTFRHRIANRPHPSPDSLAGFRFYSVRVFLRRGIMAPGW